MKGLKCGLLLALFITLGLSLNVSLDVNALKHNVQSIPFAMPMGYSRGNSNLLEPLQLVYNIHGSGIDYDPVTAWAFRSGDVADSDHCAYQSYYNAMSDDGVTISYNMPYFLDYASYIPASQSSPPILSIRCNQLKPLPDNYNWSSLPAYAFGTPNLGSYKPYWYEYSGGYGFRVKTQDGLKDSTRITMEDIFGAVPNKFKDLTIPLGLTTDNFGVVTTGRQIEVVGEFMFDSDNPDVDVLSLSNPSSTHFGLYINGYTSVSNWEAEAYESDYVECNFSIDRNNNQNEYPYILSYSCPWRSDKNYLTGYLGFSIRLWTESGDYLWDYPATTFLVASSFIITDNDDTEGSPFGIEVTGGNLDYAPGSGVYNSSSSTPDFFDSIINIFSFGFLNPFDPIFQLFSDNSSCAQIPTIAGMIHSQETQVCPWFPSSVRAIVTPVLGLSSMMLVFGFAVRWLGARSGNLFEDSMETENYSFSNKFRRKRNG